MVAMGGHTHTDEGAVACCVDQVRTRCTWVFFGVVRVSLKQDGPIMNTNNTRLSTQPALRDS